MNTTETPYPVPTSVSAEAQEWLRRPAISAAFPAVDDTAGWLAQVREIDAQVLPLIAEVDPAIACPDRMVGSAALYVHRPAAEALPGFVTLDLHPGGLIFFGGEVCRRYGAQHAVTHGVETWSLDYRMPPLHPYPAALDDALAMYETALSTHGAERILVTGVSAGGNLAAAMLLRAKDAGLPMPVALVLGTPEVDLTESGDSFETNRLADNTLTRLTEANLLYAAGHDLHHPYLSPLFGDLAGFPPTLVTAGTRDLFLSNSVRMHQNLRRAGVPAELLVYEAATHSGFGGTAPEDHERSADVTEFLHRQAGRSIPVRSVG